MGYRVKRMRGSRSLPLLVAAIAQEASDPTNLEEDVTLTHDFDLHR